MLARRLRPDRLHLAEDVHRGADARPAGHGHIAGPHTFEVTVDKPNLLVAATPDTWAWTVEDHTAPETTLVSAPSRTSVNAVATFTYSSNELDAGLQCSLDGAPFDNCASAGELVVEQSSVLPGEHTLRVRAIDPSLNFDTTPVTTTWTVVGPPVTTITDGPGALPSPIVPDTTATFVFSSDQPGNPNVTMMCSLNGSVPAACESPKTYTEAEIRGLESTVDGTSNEFTVYAVNDEFVTNPTLVDLLLEGDAVSYAWSIQLPPDTEAPNTTINTAPPSLTASTTATFEFSATDNRTLAEEITFECSLDGGPWEGCESPYTYTELTVTSHKVEIRATDTAQVPNVETTLAKHTWTITTALNNTFVGTGVTVDLLNNSVQLTFPEVTLDGATSVTQIGPVAGTLPEGFSLDHAVYYDISTTAEYAAPVEVCITYDTLTTPEPAHLLHYDGSSWIDISTGATPGQVCGLADHLSPFTIGQGLVPVVPDTIIDSGPPAITVNTGAGFFFHSNDPDATFECALDPNGPAGGDFSSCESPHQLMNLLAGQHELQVRAKNAAGIVDPSPDSHLWTIGAVPDTTIIQHPAEVAMDGNATFTFASNLSGVTFQCALDEAADSGVFMPCTSPVNYTGLAFGDHVFAVRAKDAAGNVDLSPAEFGWEVTGGAPAVMITQSPAITTENQSATFVFNAPGADMYECALSAETVSGGDFGGTFSPCLSPKTYNGLILGQYTFEVRVMVPDEAAEPPITSHMWSVVEQAPPETELLRKPANPSYAQDPEGSGGAIATFILASDDPNATFECKLDGAVWGSCPDPVEYTSLLAGTHYFAARAVDLQFNRDATPVEWTWEVITDNTAPTTTIMNLVTSTIEFETTTIVSFAANEPVESFDCQIDNQPWEQCESPYEIAELVTGPHTFRVRAIDLALNVEHRRSRGTSRSASTPPRPRRSSTRPRRPATALPVTSRRTTGRRSRSPRTRRSPTSSAAPTSRAPSSCGRSASRRRSTSTSFRARTPSRCARSTSPSTPTRRRRRGRGRTSRAPACPTRRSTRIRRPSRPRPTPGSSSRRAVPASSSSARSTRSRSAAANRPSSSPTCCPASTSSTSARSTCT